MVQGSQVQSVLGSVDTNITTYHTRREYIVKVLKETFIFDLLVSEDKRDTLALLSWCTIQELQVFQQVGHIVGSNGNNNMCGV